MTRWIAGNEATVARPGGACSRVDHMIDTIYACSLGVADWSDLCREVHEALPSAGVVMHLHDARDERNIGFVQQGFDAGAMAAYLSHYSRINPYLKGLEREPVGGLVHTEAICPLEELMRGEFWCDWLAPQGDFASGSGMVLTRQNGRHGFFGFNYTHSCEQPREDADALLRIIGPHLQRGASFWHRAANDRERIATFESVLGAMPLPVLVVDAERRLRFANDRGEAILRRLDGLVVGSDHELRAQDRAADDALAGSLGLLFASGRRRAPLVIVPKVAHEEEPGGHYVVAPCPVPREREELSFGTFRFSDGPLAMLMVHDTDAPVTLEPQVLTEAFDLTPTEAQLAVAVLEGLSPSDYALRKGVSRFTARNQLSAVMRKTGTHRQADLVGLLTRIAIAS